MFLARSQNTSKLPKLPIIHKAFTHASIGSVHAKVRVGDHSGGAMPIHGHVCVCLLHSISKFCIIKYQLMHKRTQHFAAMIIVQSRDSKR